MKKFIVLITVILLLVSCTVQQSAKMGSLTLSVDTSARGAEGLNSLTTIKYSLKRNGTVIPLNNKPSVESAVSGIATITIDDLLPGKGYQLTLSIGTKNGQYLDVAYYGTSSEFGISEGTDTAVDMTLLTAPDYIPLATSGGVSSAAVVDSMVAAPTLYILDGTALTSYPIAAEFIGTPITNLPSTTINTLSVGKYFNGTTPTNELWLNTNAGIWGKNGGGSFINISGGLTPNVLFSRAVAIVELTIPKIIGIYSGGGTILGMVVAENQGAFIDPPTSTTGWKTLDSVRAENSALDTFLSAITGDIIRGVSVNESNNIFYVSTPMGTVIGSKVLKEIVDVNAYTLKTPSEISIHVVSTADDHVFAGTDSGVYIGSFSTIINPITGIPLNGLALIPGTAGKKFVSMESFDNGTVITAAITADNTVILMEDDAVLKILDAATGIPDNAKALLYENVTDSMLHLILTGSNGAIDYNTGKSITPR